MNILVWNKLISKEDTQLINKLKSIYDNIQMKKPVLVFENQITNEIMKYSFIFLSISLNRDSLISTIKLGIRNSILIYFLLVTLFLVILIIKERKIISILKMKGFWLCAGIFSLILIFCFIKNDFQLYTFSIMLCFYYVFFALNVFTLDDFYRIFSNIMFLLSIFSLFTLFVLRPLLFNSGILTRYISVIYNAAGLPLFDFLFSYVVPLQYYIRNFGLFREPGVYQIFLNIALIYEVLLNKDKKRYLNILFLTITILSTFSTPGFAVCGLIFFIQFVKVFTKFDLLRKWKLLKAILVCFLFIFITIYLLANVFQPIKDTIVEMWVKFLTHNMSTDQRMNSILSNVNLFIKNPIIGSRFLDVLVINGDTINSSVSLVAHFGILVGILLVSLQVKFSKIITDNFWIKIIVIILLELLISTQYLLTNQIFWIFVFSPLFYRNSA